MRLSKIVALFAWFNTFAVMWMLMYGPPPEHRWHVISGLLLFICVAILASMAEAENSRNRR